MKLDRSLQVIVSQSRYTSGTNFSYFQIIGSFPQNNIDYEEKFDKNQQDHV